MLFLKRGFWLALFFMATSLMVHAEPNLELNTVEQSFLNKSQKPLQYSKERFPIIEVENTFELGKLAALSFIDWVEHNPQGVVALPSGKTPEYFIKFINYYKENWQDAKVQKELHSFGIKAASFPQTSELKFVQLDEFYGIHSQHQRSFKNYVKNYYIDTLNLKPENTLLIDLSEQGVLKKIGYEKLFPQGHVDLTLLYREATNRLEKKQKQALKEAVEYCDAYEQVIKNWGGIGFFLGGIGLDGHVAFNLPGVDHHTPSHLTKLNYQTSAQSAVDLGGIEYARDRVAMTIGLGTLKVNPNVQVIIMAAGEAKAPILQQVIELPPSDARPASLLHHLKNTKFYVTQGASSQLSARKAHKLLTKPDTFILHQTIINTALAQHQPVLSLKRNDLQQTIEGRALNKRLSDDQFERLKVEVVTFIKRNIESGLALVDHKRVLHTAPHHDDVMLSYYPVMDYLLSHNENHFAYLTSGFNSVSDQYLMLMLNSVKGLKAHKIQYEVFEQNYEQLLNRFRQAYKAKDKETLMWLEKVFVYQKMKELYALEDTKTFVKKASDLYKVLANKIPGDQEIEEVKGLKGLMRETEADRLWAIHEVASDRVHHMRSKFYTGAVFDPLPNLEQDSRPMMALYKALKPEIISVALDPEGTGPDTHYKVLQVVAQSLQHSEVEPMVWGYRNVWHRFHYAQANVFVPVLDQQIHDQDEAFLAAFSTQKSASFPSPAYDGPFSELSGSIQRSQFEDLRTLLGEDYFLSHPDSRVREASGFVLIKAMPKNEFLVFAQDLKNKTELHSMIG